MIILAIDTSGPVAGVSVWCDGAIRYEAAAVNKMTHSENIMPMVEEALLRAGVTKEQLTLLAVTVGPGSFTGVRIGVTAVKALSHALGIPCVAVDALEATAAGLEAQDEIVCPIQDARAGQVYGAVFEGKTLARLAEDEPLKLEDYVQRAAAFGRPMLFLGDGMPVHREAIASLLGEEAFFAPAHLCYLRPAAAAYLAWNCREAAVDYLSLQPLYLRAPQAERQRNLKVQGHV